MIVPRFISRFIFCAAAFLSGCGAQPTKPVEAPAPPVAPPVVDKRQELVNQLLSRADAALAMQLLSEPAGRSAYDLYKATLRVEPANPKAIEGLNKVADAYTNLIDESLRGKQINAATRHVQKARVLFPGNSKFIDKEAEIKKVRVLQPALADPKSTIAGPNQFLLPLAELKAQSKSVAVQLQNIAKRVQRTDETVIIFARSDAEGRWIYKTMRETVGNYRIRGDIKIAGTPSIQLQQPIP